jgi:hypothetical protein
MSRSFAARAALLLVLVGTGGCAAANQLAALRQVEFRFAGVSSPALAGVPLDRIHSYTDLSAEDIARFGLAVAAADVPMDIVVNVEGQNPKSNTVTARLVAMDWAYFVDDVEAVAGKLEKPVSFPPGEPATIPLRVRFNLMGAFYERGQKLAEIALAMAGRGSTTHRLTLRITPTIDTSLGPIHYPAPLEFDLSASPTR